MIRRLCRLLASGLGRPRVISDGPGKSPYLSRWYILGAPRMSDGSQPFDEFGDMRPGASWPSWGGLYLHRFHRSDADRELHNHPWRWSVSLILAGGYLEERRGTAGLVERIARLPGDFNWIGHDDFHRVDLIEEDAWTLFLVGPKVSTWGFWDRATGAFKHWRPFLDEKRAARDQAVRA